MKLFLQNTLSRNKDGFKARQGKELKLFTCGPSVYNLPHIGNYRTYLYEDVLERLFRSLGYKVNRVLNFTNIEDKAVAEAKERGLDNIQELTKPHEEKFFKDAKTLKIRIPEQIPRSSTSVDQAVELIQILLDKGHAYWHQGNVFFDPLTFKGFGKLYGLDMSRWPKKKVRFYKDTYPGQRWNLGDFILWHGGKKGDPFVRESRIGPGRPAWNVQDPAMISKHLGYELDICCGGVDNLYRHHDYNIAVLESVSNKTLAPYWLHGEHLLLNGVKMSKSKGNITYPDDLFEKGWSAQFLRFFLLSEHYRSKLDMNSEKIEEASYQFGRLRQLVEEVEDRVSSKPVQEDAQLAYLPQSLVQGALIYLYDDLDIPAAVTFMIRTLEQIAALKRDGHMSPETQKEVVSGLQSLDEVLGFVYDKSRK